MHLGNTGRLEPGKGLELLVIVIARGFPDANSGPIKGKKLLSVTNPRTVKKKTSQATRTENTSMRATPRLQASAPSVVVQPTSCCYYGDFRRRETVNRSRPPHSQKMYRFYL